MFFGFMLESRTFNILHVTLASASEEHSYDEHLQASHADHDGTLEQAEVEDTLLGAPDSAEVPVFASAEVFLLAGEGGDLAGDAEDGLFDAAQLLGSCAGLLRKVRAGLVLDLKLCQFYFSKSSTCALLPKSRSQQACR